MRLPAVPAAAPGPPGAPLPLAARAAALRAATKSWYSLSPAVNGRNAAVPSQRSQSSVDGIGVGGGVFGMPCGQLGLPIHACTSRTSPISPDQMISQATRVASCEYPWLPIWVATLYFRAASVSRRASVAMRVSGFSTYTPLPRCMHQSAAYVCM